MSDQPISLKGVYDQLLQMLKMHEKIATEAAAERLITDSTIAYLVKSGAIGDSHLKNMEDNFGIINPELSAIFKHRIEMIREAARS